MLTDERNNPSAPDRVSRERRESDMADSMRCQISILSALFFIAACLRVYAAEPPSGDSFRPVPLQSRITGVQPMTGIVMWEESENSHTDGIALEYSYLRYDDVRMKYMYLCAHCDTTWKTGEQS